MDVDWLDDDGYPTEEACERVKNWQLKDGIIPWFDFVKALWRYPHYWTEYCDESGRRYEISTGGWSGNESLIEAMESNRGMYAMTWLSSRRGGHHQFEITTKRAHAFPGSTDKETGR